MGTDPWFALRALGFSILLLLTAGIPTLVAAQNTDELVWQAWPLDGQTQILFLWGTGGTITTLGLYRLYSTLVRPATQLDEKDLATLPPGTTIHDLAINWIKILRKHQDTDLDWVKEKLPKNDPWDTSDISLKQNQTQALGRLIGALLLQLDKLEGLHTDQREEIELAANRLRHELALPDEDQMEDILNKAETALKLAKGIRQKFKEWFPKETDASLDNIIKTLEEHFAAALETYTYREEMRENVATLYSGVPRNSVTPSFVREELKRLFKLADYEPLFNIIGTLTQDEKDNIDSGDLMAREITAYILNGLTAIWKAIPARFRIVSGDTPGDIIVDSLKNIDKSLKRATTFVDRMSVSPTTTLVTEDDANTLRNAISPKYFPASGPLNYNDLLKAFQDLNKERTDALTAGKRPVPGAAPCRHPEDLSLILTGDDDQTWTDSLTQVQDLITASQNPPAPPAGQHNDERLFSTNDVPKLTDDDDYWTYRRSFEIFAKAATVAPYQLATAMARIQGRFEGKRRTYIMAYDFDANQQATWAATWKALLHYMDARFLDRDAHLELYKKWLTLRSSDKLWGQEFIAEFDRIRMTLNQIAPLQEKTVISDETSLERLMDKLPKRVRDEVRFKHPKAEFQLVSTTDPTTLLNIYDWVIDEWKHLRNTGQLDNTPPKKTTGGSKAGNNPTPSNTPSGSSPRPSAHPVWGTCNKPCWDSETQVPNGNRGPYMNIQRGRDNICPRCRRGKNEHGGHPDGCQHYGAHHWHDKPASRSAEPSGNDTGDN